MTADDLLMTADDLLMTADDLLINFGGGGACRCPEAWLHGGALRLGNEAGVSSDRPRGTWNRCASLRPAKVAWIVVGGSSE